MNNVDVRSIFEEKKIKDEISAADVKKTEGISGTYKNKGIWPHHKEDNLDRIVKQYGQSTGYSKWQKEKYAVKVDRKWAK